jgi:3-methyladenine DNA glycosylase/8-oxoguanine DNA glycosylase
MSASKSFRFPKPHPYDPEQSFSLLALGPYDPSFRRIEQRGWRTVRWIDGSLCTVTLACGSALLGVRLDGPEEALAAVGEEHARALLGLDDAAGWSLAARDPLRPYVQGKPGLRLVRAFWLYEGAVNAVLSQRVSWREAVENWQRLCRRFGEERDGLFSCPSPGRLLALSYAELASCGIEARRAIALKGAAERLRRLPAADLPAGEVERLLQGCRGIGPWTRTLLRAQFWGDADAVPLGDYGLPALVCAALAGERGGTDERMLELLEPYRGERFRAIRYLWTDRAPWRRRGPRLPVGQALGS